MKETILLITQNGKTRREISNSIETQGYSATALESRSEALERRWQTIPAVLLLENRNDPAGLSDLIRELKYRFTSSKVMILAKKAEMRPAMEALKNEADDFISMPVNPLFLEMALKRAVEAVRLYRRIAVLEKGAKAGSTPPTGTSEPSQKQRSTEVAGLVETERSPGIAGLVETERFVAVRQVVDKVSTIIGQISRCAQGGMRYFQETPYFVSIHSREGRLIAANEHYKRYLGNRIGCDSWAIYSRKRAGRRMCPVGITIDSGNAQAITAVVKYVSGVRVPVIVHTAPIFNNDGEVELILEVAAGTREIEHLSKELRTTQQRYQELFEEVPCHVAVLDTKFRFLAANRLFRETFGDETGSSFFELFTACNQPHTDCPIRMTATDGKRHNAEMVLTAENGTRYHTVAWTAPIFTDTGKLIQILVTFIDITEIRELRDNLSSLGLMIGSISHGLKGTLTGLNAGLYLIETGFYREKPGRIEEGLDVAKLMADHVKKMVADILYCSKERPLQREPVDAARFAADIAATVETRIRGANIAFVCDIAKGLGEFTIDESLIRSALVNILDNAMEACIEDPSPLPSRVNFSVFRDGNNIRFDIRDTGTGIKREELKNIFTLFYSSKGNRGTGLGLYITKTIIKKHGGEIGVNSAEGSGTRFRILLPVTPAGFRQSGVRIPA